MRLRYKKGNPGEGETVECLTDQGASENEIVENSELAVAEHGPGQTIPPSHR
jgi:hypothetical protein